MRQQIITPGRSPLWSPGWDEETYERSRIVVPPEYRRRPRLATISLLDHTIVATATGNNATTPAIDSTGATLLVVMANWSASTTLTDSKSNTWLIAETANVSGSSQLIYYCNPGANVGSGHTASFTGTATAVAGSFLAFSGTDTSSPLDQHTKLTNGSSSNSQATGSITPGSDNQLLVYCVGFGYANTMSVDGGVSILDQVPFAAGVSFNLAVAYEIQTSAVARSATFSSSTGGVFEAASIASFKAAAGGGGVALRQNALLNGLGSSGPFFRNPLG